MDVKSSEKQGYVSVTIISIGIGIWIGLAAGPKWYWNALLAAIVLALITLFLPLKMYQTYKLECAKQNKQSSIIRWLVTSSLYNSAWIYPFGLFGRGIKFVFTWLTA
jgi:hypothetical protein